MKAAPREKIEEITEELIEIPEDKLPIPPELQRLYKLSILKGSAQETKLIWTERQNNLPELIEQAKNWCAMNRCRFLFIEPAVITL